MPDTICFTRGEAECILEELEEYHAIETELREKYHANADMKELRKYFIETIFKGEKHDRFCILTNEEAKMWEEYQSIGTVEEIMERLTEREEINKCLEIRGKGGHT